MDDEYEVDENPILYCDHCGEGSCHFANKDRCICSCYFGPRMTECPSGKHIGAEMRIPCTEVTMQTQFEYYKSLFGSAYVMSQPYGKATSNE